MQDDRVSDLFGNPVRPNRGRRGRPCLEIAPEDRDAVEAALVRGWSNERIAKVVGISPASLKRYFRAALAKRDVARDKMEVALFAAQARAALAGNTSAAKQVRAVMERDEMTRAKAALRQVHEEARDRGVGLGKKEAAELAARAVGQSDDWGDLLNPGGGLH